MIQLSIRAKGTCELPNGSKVNYTCEPLTIDKCSTLEELAETFSEDDVIDNFYKSYVIAKQAEMRREQEAIVFKEHGYEKVSTRALPPELKAINARLSSLSKEEREALLAKINSIL